MSWNLSGQINYRPDDGRGSPLSISEIKVTSCREPSMAIDVHLIDRKDPLSNKQTNKFTVEDILSIVDMSVPDG